jgi:hypothetical protein
MAGHVVGGGIEVKAIVGLNELDARVTAWMSCGNPTGLFALCGNTDEVASNDSVRAE